MENFGVEEPLNSIILFEERRKILKHSLLKFGPQG